MNRREFIGGAASALALGGCGTLTAAARRPEPDFYWSYLAHFGINSWRDTPLETADPNAGEHYLTRCVADHVRFEEDEWRLLADRLAAAGCNQIIIDLAEIVTYPSHPELAVKGSWSPDRLRDELARLRGMGFEVVPKMNFSACHDTWLKDYHRMVSTKRYYQVCADVIRDAVEIFGNPRLFHLGYDEETAAHQRGHLFTVCRQGDLWWHDFLWFADTVEKLGCRPWIWSDYIWNHREEFVKRMPRSVLQSNWYYGASFETKDKDGKERTYVAAYEWLDKAGFDQVPTGSNFSCDTNFADTVKFCDAHCDASRIKGYMMAPWTRTFKIHHNKSFAAIDQLESARKARR